MSKRLAKKVLVIGWDAADWKVISPLLDSGQMPTLEKFINEGVMGNIATLKPCLSPMLWTSIATGKRADKHGIHGFTEPSPKTGGIRPVTCISRKVKAIWNILTQKSMKSNIVSWWPTHPAEPIDGVCVSNLYQHAQTPINEPWPLVPGTIHPERLNNTLKELRVHPAELTEGHILPFVPNAAKVDRQKDPRLVGLARIIADCTTVHSAATWIMENEPWDFMAVYYDGIDHFGHGFMHFHPPRMESVDEELFNMYKNVVAGGYRYHDMMLERLLHLAGPDTTVILLSDHGFHPDHLRPRGIPKEPAGPAIQHREYGIICMKGPHIKKDERIYGASLLDICPTVLTLFGLPVGDDMDGRPLLQAFDEIIEPEKIPSWEAVPGECGMHSPDDEEDPWAAKEMLDQLVALGYIDPPDDDQEKTVARTVREAKYNLAQVYLDGNQPRKAIEILEELVGNDPNELRFSLQLAKGYLDDKDLDSCRKLVERTLEREENIPLANKLMGSLLFAEGNVDEALKYLLKAEETGSHLPNLHCQIGNAYLKMERWQDAERAFRTALSIDGDNAHAYNGLAQALIATKRFEEGATQALRAVGLLHHLPLGHYHLGVSLAHLGWPERAVQAFEQCLSMKPDTEAAHRWLAQIYEKALNNRDKAKYHSQKANELSRG